MREQQLLARYTWDSIAQQMGELIARDYRAKTKSKTMATVAFWMITSGVIGGIIAAPFGWIDWFAIPSDTRAKSVGLWHGVGNMAVLLLFIGSWLLRFRIPELPSVLALVLSFAGAGLSLITAWLGGELVDRLGVGVDPGAHLNAPSSLSEKSIG